MADVTDYTALITSEHASAPKFMATVGVLAQPFVDLQNLFSMMPDYFDLDHAIGAQLDVVGEWAGISRQIATPINTYFMLDVVGLGFDQGNWQGPFDSSTGLTSLDDATYRTVLRAKIAANSWDGTTVGAAAGYAGLFGDSGTYIFIQDNQDMTMTVGVSGQNPSALLAALLSGNYLPLKPAGVQVNYAFSSVSNTPIFGFDVENQYISGFDVGSYGIPGLATQNFLDYTMVLDQSTLG